MALSAMLATKWFRRSFWEGSDFELQTCQAALGRGRTKLTQVVEALQVLFAESVSADALELPLHVHGQIARLVRLEEVDHLGDVRAELRPSIDVTHRLVGAVDWLEGLH